MSRTPTTGRGPFRSHGGAVAVMQRLLDAFWIFCAHNVANQLYPGGPFPAPPAELIRRG